MLCEWLTMDEIEWCCVTLLLWKVWVSFYIII